MTAVPGALASVNLHLVENFEDASAFMRWLGERHEVLAIDTETGGLEWWRVPLRLVQIGDTQTGWAIPRDWLGLVAEALNRYDGPIVLHNLKFDMHMLSRYGITLPRAELHDTSIMAHILDPYGPRALKNLAKREIDPWANSGQKSLKEGMARHKWTWETVPVNFPPYWIYSALDPVITARLWVKWHRHVITAFHDVYELELATAIIVHDMETRGVRVDLEYTSRQHDRLDGWIGETKSWVYEEFGIRPTNAEIARRFILDGIELTQRTEKDTGWKMDEAVLSGIDHPLARVVLDIRNAQKIKNTYFRNILKFADGDRIHPDVNTLGAITGRMSVSRPAFQQLPSGSPVVRDCVIPSLGNNLISTDWDQIELRLLAHFANEEKMIRAIHDGVDLHTFAAQQIFRVDEPTKPQRKAAKGGSFAKVYGAGAATFAEQQGIPEEEAAAFLSMYDATFPGVPAFAEEVERIARDRLFGEGEAYVITPVGRKHRIFEEIGENGRPSMPYYRLVNYLIQGSAADLLKQKIVALDSAGLGEYLALLVHDEVIADVPTAEAEDAAHAIGEVMTDLDSWAVPLTASGEVVSRWGDNYDYHKQGKPEECHREFCPEYQGAKAA